MAKPAKPLDPSLPPFDPDDATVRMAPDRVVALLRAQDEIPEPIEATPGRPTRVLDAQEVAHAQRELSHLVEPGRSPRAPEPPPRFEVAPSVRARPPRSPSGFATLPPHALTPSEPSSLSRSPLAGRLVRGVGLALMALFVFAMAFGLTRLVRDGRTRAESRDLVVEVYDAAAAWFSGLFGREPEPARPLPAGPVFDARTRPPAARTRALATQNVDRPLAGATNEPRTPVVRLEDLAPLPEAADLSAAGKPGASSRPRR